MKKTLIILALLLTSSFAQEQASEQELLNQRLIVAVKKCSLGGTKWAIENGADKNTISALFLQAAGYGSIKCAETAHYLSSIGADSQGITHLDVKTHKYDKPKVFENKHLNMTIEEIRFDGYSKIRLRNKADEPIYI
jgi:hypothetical protein